MKGRKGDRIIVKNVSKKFRIGRKPQSSLARFISIFSGKEPKKNFLALKNVSFNVEKGEILGLIGDNGSGKSSLLRIIAGIYDSDEGSIYTDGKIISLINLFIGLQERLTMRDNIYMCCSLFGLYREDIGKRFYSIVEFAELESFLNTKLYQFSDGMLQRLAFSIAIHCDPEILLIDEVFEVGDEEFREKSSRRIREIVRNGGSVILISHDMNMIRKYCDRALWLDDGKIKEIGRPKEIIGGYLRGSGRKK